MTSADPIQYGQLKASYFWDDGSGRNGDTGAPASGEPMQKGLFASPSWPLGTEGYVEYNGERVDFFIGDRGPGHPAENCDVLLDIDGETFAELTGESFDKDSLTVSGGNGHIDVEYYITEWGDGDGNEGAPHAMGDEANRCEDAVSEPAEQERGGDERDEEVAAQPEPQEGGQHREEPADDRETGQSESAGTADGQDGAPPQAEKAPEREQATQAETAANQISGIELAGGDTPLAAGTLTLALLPVLIVALLFAGRRSSVGHTPSGGPGRHRRPSPVGGLRRRLPGDRW